MEVAFSSLWAADVLPVGAGGHDIVPDPDELKTLTLYVPIGELPTLFATVTLVGTPGETLNNHRLFVVSKDPRIVVVISSGSPVPTVFVTVPVPSHLQEVLVAFTVILDQVKFVALVSGGIVLLIFPDVEYVSNNSLQGHSAGGQDPAHGHAQGAGQQQSSN